MNSTSNGDSTSAPAQSTALVRAPTTTTAQWDPQTLDEGMRLAEILSRASQVLPVSLRGKPADVLVVLMTGHELGLSPMQSMRSLHVIEGKGVLSSDLLVALAKRSPACAYFRLVESTAERAIYETQRHGEPQPTRMDFTLEEAQRAGLGAKDNWKKFPAAMLRARAGAALARAVYPDVVAGIYDPDEIPTTAAVTATASVVHDDGPADEQQQSTPDEEIRDRVRLDLQACATEEDLDALAKRVARQYPRRAHQEMHVWLREVGAARRAQIQAAAATPETREPGADG